MTTSVLIIEDDDIYARSLARIIGGEGFEPVIARTGEEALAVFDDVRPALVLVDIMLPGVNGIEVMQSITEKATGAVCIVVSGLATVENAVEAMRAGAFDIIQKSTNINEVLVPLRRAVDMANLRRHMLYLQSSQGGFGEIIGMSPAMGRLKSQIDDIAGAPTSTVLVVGETGTGKELVARAVHRMSTRSDQPMISVNCAAVPENLLESEFFGHEKGAFTGADRAKQGFFEMAHGGTLFLDEIGELDLRLQAKLLRVFEERILRRVGGTKDILVDVRFIAATNRDLAQNVKVGSFREDLLYRLNVFQIDVPPLRDRGEDILLLAEHFMMEFSRQMGKRVHAIHETARDAIANYDFPGNVRQLRNLMEQAVILAKGDKVTVDLLRGIHTPIANRGGGLVSMPPAAPVNWDGDFPALMETLHSRQRDVETLERKIFDRALREADGNKTRAAEILGMSRYAFQRRIKRLDEPTF